MPCHVRKLNSYKESQILDRFHPMSGPQALITNQKYIYEYLTNILIALLLILFILSSQIKSIKHILL